MSLRKDLEGILPTSLVVNHALYLSSVDIETFLWGGIFTHEDIVFCNLSERNVFCLVFWCCAG